MYEHGITSVSAIPIGLDDIRQAAERIAPWAHRTPVMTSQGARCALRRLGLPQVRELSEGRRVQVPRRDERGPATERGRAATRRDHAFLGQPRAGRGAGRAACSAFRSPS